MGPGPFVRIAQTAHGCAVGCIILFENFAKIDRMMHRVARAKKPTQFKASSLQEIPQEGSARGEFDFAALCYLMRLQGTLHHKQISFQATSCHVIPVQDPLDHECATSNFLLQDDSLYHLLDATACPAFTSKVEHCTSRRCDTKSHPSKICARSKCRDRSRQLDLQARNAVPQITHILPSVSCPAIRVTRKHGPCCSVPSIVFPLSVAESFEVMVL